MASPSYCPILFSLPLSTLLLYSSLCDLPFANPLYHHTIFLICSLTHFEPEKHDNNKKEVSFDTCLTYN